jgi:hypothetical protein
MAKIMENELEVKVKKIVENPKISLKQFSRYSSATVNGKNSILIKSKYPSDYVPRFYEMARKFICDTFGANFKDHILYFDEFIRHASKLKKEAIKFPVNKDTYKNRIRSADGLVALTKMGAQIVPLLEKYVLNSNISNRRDSITIEGVKIGAMADMLLFEDSGLTPVGFLKFNFTQKAMTKLEAEYMLHVLRSFFREKRGLELNLTKCILIDVFSSKIYTAVDPDLIEEPAKKHCREINEKWPFL